jgi:hypothetical protein
LACSDFTTPISVLDVPLLFHLGIIFKGDIRDSPICSLQILSVEFLVVKKSAMYCHKCTWLFMKSILQCGQILIKLKFSRQIFEVSINLKFHEHPSGGSRCVPCERTDGRTYRQTDRRRVWTDRQTEMTKLTAAFRNLAKAHKKVNDSSTITSISRNCKHKKTNCLNSDFKISKC